MNGTPQAIEPSRKLKITGKDYSIFIKSGSVAANSLLLALHLGANAKMLAMLDPKGDAAGSIVSTFQTVLLGSATGCLLSTGIEMGPAVGAEEYERAGQIAKASWVLTIALGISSTLAMIATPLVFPYMFEEKASKIASDFFLGYAVGGIPELMLMTSPQIAFQAGEWYIPTAAGIVAYGPSSLLSYLFGFYMNMGAFGVGLGGSVAAYISTLAVQLWLKRNHYDQFKLYEFPITDLKKNLVKLLETGGQVALQRLTEWGNLFALTLAMGSGPSNVLSAAQPAIQYTAILALSLQGLAHATTMMIISNKAIMNNAMVSGDMEKSNDMHHKNIYTFVGNNTVGSLLTASLCGIFYLKRKDLADFFLSSDSEPDTHDLAQTFLWISMIGMIPDAIRIISLGSLRGFKDVFWPTFSCLLVMTAVGVPTGYGVSESEDDWSQMFVIRNIAIAISAIIVARRCAAKIADEQTPSSTLTSSEHIAQESDPLGKKSSTSYTTNFCGYLSRFRKNDTPLEADEASAGLIDSGYGTINKVRT